MLKKILQPLIGFNLKDTLSNVGAICSLAGSLVLVGTETGNIPARYEKQAQGLLGAGVVLIGYATGKRGDLQAGQVDQVVPPPLVSLSSSTLPK